MGTREGAAQELLGGAVNAMATAAHVEPGRLHYSKRRGAYYRWDPQQQRTVWCKKTEGVSRREVARARRAARARAECRHAPSMKEAAAADGGVRAQLLCLLRGDIEVRGDRLVRARGAPGPAGGCQACSPARAHAAAEGSDCSS